MGDKLINSIMLLDRVEGDTDAIKREYDGKLVFLRNQLKNVKICCLRGLVI